MRPEIFFLQKMQRSLAGKAFKILDKMRLIIIAIFQG